MKRYLFLTVIILFCSIPFSHAYRVRGIINMESTYSNKKLSLEEFVKRSRASGLDVVFFSDDAISRIKYGIYPLRNLISYTYENDSVLKIGPEIYLNEINLLKKKYPDMILIPGVEAAAFYFWEGSYLKDKQLSLNNWHQHMLVVGLEKPEDYKNLPLMSNPNAGTYEIQSIGLLWPVLLIIPLLFLYGRNKYFLSVLILLVVVISLANNYPFLHFPYDQYHGDMGPLPYQRLIDYVKSKGGLIFWAHPDSPDFKDSHKTGSITLKTSSYGNKLLSTHNYDGFAVFYEGYKQTGVIGGYWDKALIEYCTGKRKKPVWAIGEIDYIDEPHIDDVQIVINVKDKTPESVLESMRNGNYYTYLKAPGNDYLDLDSFSVNTSGNGFPILNIKVSSTKTLDTAWVKILLIKNGEHIKTFHSKAPVEINYKDETPNYGTLNFYRLDITQHTVGHIISNPVFF